MFASGRFDSKNFEETKKLSEAAPFLSTAGGHTKQCLYPYCSVNPNNPASLIGDLIHSRIPSTNPRRQGSPLRLQDSNNIFNNRYLSSNATIPEHVRPKDSYPPSTNVQAPISDEEKRKILAQTGHSSHILQALYPEFNGIFAAKKPSNLVEHPRVNEKYQCGNKFLDFKSSGLIGADKNPIRAINGIFFNDKQEKPLFNDLILNRQLSDPLSHHRQTIQSKYYPYDSLSNVPLPLAGTFYDSDDLAALKAWNNGHKKSELIKYDPYLLSEGIKLRNSTLYKAPQGPPRNIGRSTTSGGVSKTTGHKLDLMERSSQQDLDDKRREIEKACRSARENDIPLRDVTDGILNKNQGSSILDDTSTPLKDSKKRRHETIKVPGIQQQTSSRSREGENKVLRSPLDEKSVYEDDVVTNQQGSSQRDGDTSSNKNNGSSGGMRRVLDPICRKQHPYTEQKSLNSTSQRQNQYQGNNSPSYTQKQLSPQSVWKNRESTQQKLISGSSTLQNQQHQLMRNQYEDDEFMDAAAQAQSSPGYPQRQSRYNNHHHHHISDRQSIGAETVQRQIEDIKADLRVIKEVSPGAPLRDKNQKGFTMPLRRDNDYRQHEFNDGRGQQTYNPARELRTIEQMENQNRKQVYIYNSFQPTPLQRELLESQGYLQKRESNLEQSSSQNQNLHLAYKQLEKEINSIKKSLKIDGASTQSLSQNKHSSSSHNRHPQQMLNPTASGMSAYRSSRASRKSKTGMTQDDILSLSMSEGMQGDYDDDMQEEEEKQADYLQQSPNDLQRSGEEVPRHHHQQYQGSPGGLDDSRDPYMHPKF